jgi:endonuclease/exonuclease/phosphatase family metal-dependent hydrolase
VGDPVLRIAQLNCASCFEPGWPERRHDVVAWIERLAPDVVCLEEVCERDPASNTAGWVAHELSQRSGIEWHWSFGGDGLSFKNTDSTLRFGSAVLSRWPIDTFTYYRLPLADEPSSFLRAIPWEVVHARTAGLDVFATHLAAAPSDGLHRQVQVLEIDAFVRRVRGSLDDVVPGGPARAAMPAVLCGDFNAEPDSDEIRFLSGLCALGGRTTFWQEAWRSAGTGPGLTQDWSVSPLAAMLNVHRKRIDYVFVGDPFLREGDAGRVLRAELAFHEPLTGVMASDHLGLVVDVLWPGRPA